jgi:transcriptional regulator with XRE-family HTH domain
LNFVRDNALGTTLRQMREARQMSRARLAHLAGLTADSLARFEAGEARIPATALSRFATGLGVPLSALFAVPACAIPAQVAYRGVAVH